MSPHRATTLSNPQLIFSGYKLVWRLLRMDITDNFSAEKRYSSVEKISLCSRVVKCCRKIVSARDYKSNLVHVLFLLLGMFTLTACQAESKMLSAPVTGYNHTSSVINNFSVNGAGGANIGAHQGGGTEVCCGMVPRHWSAGLKAIVEWEVDPAPRGAIKRDQYGQLDTKDYERHAANYTHHKVVVDIPRYDVPGSLKVHFLPCNEVRVSATGITPGYPGYPYNYPMNMPEPKTCPSR